MIDCAVILCGGRGSRLGALTDNCPKPMLPVGGRPFLDRLITQITFYEIKRFILVAGYLGEQIEDAYTPEWATWRNLDITVVRELDPKGTLPALWLAYHLLHGVRDLLLCNGDTIFQMNPKLFHQAPLPGHIQAFKMNGQDSGVRVIHSCRQVVRELVEAGKTSIEGDLFPALGHKVLWRAMKGQFLDIGSPETYALACNIFR